MPREITGKLSHKRLLPCRKRSQSAGVADVGRRLPCRRDQAIGGLRAENLHKPRARDGHVLAQTGSRSVIHVLIRQPLPAALQRNGRRRQSVTSEMLPSKDIATSPSAQPLPVRFKTLKNEITIAYPGICGLRPHQTRIDGKSGPAARRGRSTPNALHAELSTTVRPDRTMARAHQINRIADRPRA